MCTNQIQLHAPRGYFNVVHYEVQCGNTDHHGRQAICSECRADPAEMQRISAHQANVDADNAWLQSAGWGEL